MVEIVGIGIAALQEEQVASIKLQILGGKYKVPIIRQLIADLQLSDCICIR